MAARAGSLAKQVHLFQEALTRLALLRSGVPEQQLFWGKKLAGAEGQPHDGDAGIDADLVVAADPDRPERVIQVRHSGSRKEQEKKFWREVHDASGYLETSTPIMVNKRLWEQSGHWEISASRTGSARCTGPSHSGHVWVIGFS